MADNPGTANEATEATSEATRPCEWCKSAIAIDALRCPQCNGWRKDIRGNKIAKWVSAGLMVFVGAIYLFMISQARSEAIYTSGPAIGLYTLFGMAWLIALVASINLFRKTGNWAELI